MRCGDCLGDLIVCWLMRERKVRSIRDTFTSASRQMPVSGAAFAYTAVAVACGVLTVEGGTGGTGASKSRGHVIELKRVRHDGLNARLPGRLGADSGPSVKLRGAPSITFQVEFSLRFVHHIARLGFYSAFTRFHSNSSWQVPMKMTNQSGSGACSCISPGNDIFRIHPFTPRQM